MLIHIVIITGFILLASFLNIILLRYLIKKKLDNFDFKSSGKYILSKKKIYLLINFISMDVWYVEDITNEDEWIKFKKKLPRFFLTKEINIDINYFTLFNSPDSTEIAIKHMFDHTIIHLAKILSLKYNFKKKYITYLLYFSGEINSDNINRFAKDNNFCCLLSNRQQSLHDSDKIKSTYKYNSKLESIEIIYDFDTKSFFFKAINKVEPIEYNKYIKAEIDDSIPLYSYWKTLLVIIVFILSYIVKIN